MLSLCAALCRRPRHSSPPFVVPPGTSSVRTHAARRRSGQRASVSKKRPVEGPSLAASRTATRHMSTAHDGLRPSVVRARSASPSRSPTSSPCRPRASTGCSATSAGRPGSPRPRPRAATTSPTAPASRRSSRRSPRSRTSAARCRCRSATTASRSVKYSIEECKERDKTYSAPLFVTAEFMNNTTGEIKSQTVFMGDFPLMTERGTFIINGTERVVVSQLVRSPGRLLRAHARQDVRQGHLHRQGHPEPRCLARVRDRQARHGRRPRRPQAQAVRHRAAQGPRLDRRRRSSRSSATTSRCALTLEKDHTAGQDDALLDIYRKLRPGEPPTKEAAQTLLDNLYFNPQALRPRQGRPLQDQQEARPRARRSAQSTLTVDDIVATIKYIVAPARRRGRPCRVAAAARTSTSASRSTTSTTSATVACATSASSSRTRSAPACPGWSASSASG